MSHELPASKKKSTENFRTLINGRYEVKCAAVNRTKADNGYMLHLQFMGIDTWIFISTAGKNAGMNEVNERTAKACKKAMKKGKELDMCFWTSGIYDNCSLTADYLEHHNQTGGDKELKG